MPNDVTFNPAETLREAAARMLALTRAADVGTRGPKRALVALATGLGLDVDLVEVNAVLRARIANELAVPWRAGRDYVDLQVTLTGMNSLLMGATHNLARLSMERRIGGESAAKVLAAFPGFRPARNKQEAVNRMCDLAGVPHDKLGPGGKEHTWTLMDLARRLAPKVLDAPDEARTGRSPLRRFRRALARERRFHRCEHHARRAQPHPRGGGMAGAGRVGWLDYSGGGRCCAR